ncbi:MAG: NADH-quinone oxidoreductase subunit H [Epsilonproteobacteria bacterium]|nr:NADH-quinone oxidoreductase subunit H [Campylobacterota bacterium]
MSLSLVFVTVLNILIVVLLALGGVPVLVWLERRVAGFIQDRSGPNRCHIAGFRLGGLIQSFADMLKLVFKEDIVPSHIKYKFYFSLAPTIILFASLLTFSVIPFADKIVLDGVTYSFQALPVSLGIVWFLAFAGLSVYGIILAGWSSDNKYSLLGGLRASASTISYEPVMALSVIAMLIVYGSIDLNDMVAKQSGTIFGFLPSWGIFLQPLAAIVFIVAAFAEANRTPFDLAEGESEIVGGYHTEYGAMKFGLFFVGEYVAMSVSSAVIVTMFFGGYNLPWLSSEYLRGHIEFFSIALLILLPLSSYFFVKWMYKNNRWKKKSDIRNKESAVIKKVVIALNIAIILALLYFGVLNNSVYSASVMGVIFQFGVFVTKLFMMNLVYIWVRWTLPRFRYDQLQMLCWKYLLPISMANVFVTALAVVYLGA